MHNKLSADSTHLIYWKHSYRMSGTMFLNNPNLFPSTIPPTQTNITPHQKLYETKKLFLFLKFYFKKGVLQTPPAPHPLLSNHLTIDQSSLYVTLCGKPTLYIIGKYSYPTVPVKPNLVYGKAKLVVIAVWTVLYNNNTD